MHYKERITTNPKVMLGKPVTKGTRITVELILRKLSEGMSINDLLKAYPHLKKEDIFAALSYSADVISKDATLLKIS
ncbi:MAG: antitoxin [Candidatus Fischerbacteria bacterium RBG_13_37_8]|uniref:Antitoxin n=1 Tax=Candidatus Fischerbacteria bacterium RBG_13_37_8 TaxID=1817863 RepID=A0A1F5VUR7_9BACT|nr:MAG: antitoxin [Candidatus Fischerbacteria bacterium RBG_13_37_8]